MSLPAELTAVFFLSLSFPVLANGEEKEERGGFLAGAAAADITPPPGLPLWGYGARKDIPARGTRDPLACSVVVIEAAGKRLALVGLDLGRSPARATERWIREKAREEAGVEHVLLVGSHTHHAPCVELEDVEPTASWVRSLREAVAGAIISAAGDLRPARIAVVSGEIELNRNRHTKIEPKPVDRTLRVLRLEDPDGETIATVVNFAAHPTTLPAPLLEYSADYPGAVRKHVEKELGGRCVFLQGAAGDLSTDRGGRDTEEYGEALGEEVVRLLDGVECVAPAAPSLDVRREELRFSARVDLEDPLTYAKFVLAFFKDLVDAYVEEYRDGVRPSLTVALLNGDIGIVGASGEFFCAHAIRLRERARLKELLFLGYCNGYHQYFPTIEAVAEGGYGARKGEAPVEVGAGERMMDRALLLLYRMREKIDG